MKFKELFEEGKGRPTEKERLAKLGLTADVELANKLKSDIEKKLTADTGKKVYVIFNLTQDDGDENNLTPGISINFKGRKQLAPDEQKNAWMYLDSLVKKYSGKFKKVDMEKMIVYFHNYATRKRYKDWKKEK